VRWVLDLDGGTLKQEPLDVGEPIFVPRSPRAAEGEGYLLAVAYRSERDRSDLLILDAENVEAEPVAVVHLPHRIPGGFHGNWRPAK
jgi:carotenoid cleavage dioxygenase